MVAGKILPLRAAWLLPRCRLFVEWSADLFAFSRQAIKKYIHANNNLGATTDAAFNSHLSRALASGEEQGTFARPKGTFVKLFR